MFVFELRDQDNEEQATIVNSWQHTFLTEGGFVHCVNALASLDETVRIQRCVSCCCCSLPAFFGSCSILQAMLSDELNRQCLGLLLQLVQFFLAGDGVEVCPED